MPIRLALLTAIAALAFGFIVFRLLSERWGIDPIDIPASEALSEPPARVEVSAGDLEGIECSLDVERWDSGDRAEVERKYGANAEAVVEGCRDVVAPPAP